MKAKVMPDGRLSLPAELRKKHGLAHGGEDIGDAIVLRTLDQVVARAQALSRKLVAGKPGASVDDFLAERARGGEGVTRVALDASALLGGMAFRL